MDTLTNAFRFLLHTSLISTALILLIIIIRSIIKNKISSNYIYFLWIIIMIRLVFPFSVPSILSFENIIDNTVIGQFDVEQETEDNSNLTTQEIKSNVSKEIYKPLDNNEKLFRLLTYIWLFGIFIIMFIPIVSYITLKKELLKDESADDLVKKAAINAGTKLGLVRSFDIVYSYYIDAPALIGVIKPIIVLPYDKKGVDYDTIYNILLHELVHYKKKHLLFQWLFWIIKAVYWFNPIIWITHSLMKQDAELACDEEVIAIIGDSKKQSYGHLLVDMAQNSDSPNYIVNAAGLLNKKSELKQRITKLTQKTRQSKLVRATAIVLIVILVPIFFTAKAVVKQEMPERVIKKAINDETILVDGISIKPIEYEFNTKTEVLNVTIDYMISEELYNMIKEPFEIKPFFDLTFPGSLIPEIRNLDIKSELTSSTRDKNKGVFVYSFSVDDYDQEEFGRAKLLFEGAQIENKVNNIAVELSKEDLPITIKIDDLLTITYDYLEFDKNKALLKYRLIPSFEIDISLWDKFYIKDEGSLYKSNSSSACISDNGVERQLDFTNIIDSKLLEMKLKSYTVHIGTNEAMLYNGEKNAWRFYIDKKGEK